MSERDHRFARAQEATDAPDGSGASLIAAERLRQITGEGWTPEHDDTHTRGELAKAAGVYAMPFNGSWKAELWPWEPEALKFTHQGDHNRVRELVKAGALIAAEIDRLNRLDPSSSGQRPSTEPLTEGPLSQDGRPVPDVPRGETTR